jgi:hypothetical protein
MTEAERAREVIITLEMAGYRFAEYLQVVGRGDSELMALWEEFRSLRDRIQEKVKRGR